MEKIIIVGIVLLFIMITGFILHNLGRPLNTLIFTIHKLSAVAIAILLGIIIFNFFKISGIDPVILFISILISLSFVVLFVSGAFLSINKFSNTIPTLLIIHNIATVVVVISIIVLVYFLLMLK